MIPTFRGGNTNLFEHQLEIYKQAGLGTDTVFDPVRGIPDYGYLTHSNRMKPLAEQDIPGYWPARRSNPARLSTSMRGAWRSSI
jgi:hypothetical protein